MDKAITVDHLVKKYKEHTAVDGISFEVGKGEFFSLLGENGAGKTTTINILCTILEKTAGSVKVYDHELGVDEWSSRSWRMPPARSGSRLLCPTIAEQRASPAVCPC